MDKIIMINTFAGKRVYVATTEEKWRELVEGVEVFGGYHVNGWALDQDKVLRIIEQDRPECDAYKVVAVSPWRDYYEGIYPFAPEMPTPNYFIVYSSMDRR